MPCEGAQDSSPSSLPYHPTPKAGPYLNSCTQGRMARSCSLQSCM